MEVNPAWGRVPLTLVVVEEEEEEGAEGDPGCPPLEGTAAALEVVAVEVEVVGAVVVACHPWFNHQGQRIARCWLITLPSRWVRWRKMWRVASLGSSTFA